MCAALHHERVTVLLRDRIGQSRGIVIMRPRFKAKAKRNRAGLVRGQPDGDGLIGRAGKIFAAIGDATRRVFDGHDRRGQIEFAAIALDLQRFLPCE
jgi:hypothetical protein